ncbi:MAG: hypothetical protein A2499_02705 [Stygiobacter sp. RIFOXYC12_FULL_38_8]|nr:MAG: hypothetical protein A2X62_05480 [Stygiobacter sp. GWC2_38_9]OGU82752.1 MAG: hypothetical protein A2279_05490 [Stygiobacter sp. RIFOXYA12_FULL_38_9]OGV05874.1 MAG: hypothetical protein A2299_10585 [Stygiobacter sp. RIFOXYB2_FULL_37_11]OGV11986.1 MAG: hypothetical protein A2237_15445 [Stygiobacter sp. RIFOXYA2_FULL_38_8]OGV14465.1 MAG: hypothetical protein A2440_08480 [Stygiobacter sp. RIFOXYC2_FULL_38_25]OGV27473.1 MAG: hypothetical protein A2499_02705 [Stygiobacter sp. RIFOXYC12_FULL_
MLDEFYPSILQDKSNIDNGVGVSEVQKALNNFGFRNLELGFEKILDTGCLMLDYLAAVF